MTNQVMVTIQFVMDCWFVTASHGVTASQLMMISQPF
jgi:hypothetical protein